jgi:anti-sigma B factor antagonist
MEFSSKEMKRCEIAYIGGRIDSSTAPELQEQLNGLLKRGRYNLVLNMKNVAFLSSAGLRALLSTLQACKRHGGDVRLSEASEQVARVLELTSFDVYFKCFASDTEAVGSF